MDALTRTRLLKLLVLTASSHDGEALAASRMANKLLKRTGSSWAEFFADRSGGLDTAPDHPREASQARRGPGATAYARSPNFGTDTFGDAPAWTAAPPARVIRAGKVRLFLARIPWPVRLLLGPLTAAGYLTAWTMEGESPTDRAPQAALSGIIVVILAALWAEIIGLLLAGHSPF